MDRREINIPGPCYNVSYGKTLYEMATKDSSKVNSSIDSSKKVTVNTNLIKTKTIFRSSSKLHASGASNNRMRSMERKQSVKANKTKNKEETKQANTNDPKKTNAKTIKEKINFFEAFDNNANKEGINEKQSESGQSQSRKSGHIKNASSNSKTQHSNILEKKKNNQKISNVPSYNKAQKCTKSDQATVNVDTKPIDKKTQKPTVVDEKKTKLKISKLGSGLSRNKTKPKIKTKPKVVNNETSYSTTHQSTEPEQAKIEDNASSYNEAQQSIKLQEKNTKVEINKADNVPKYSESQQSTESEQEKLKTEATDSSSPCNKTLQSIKLEEHETKVKINKIDVPSCGKAQQYIETQQKIIETESEVIETETSEINKRSAYNRETQQYSRLDEKKTEMEKNKVDNVSSYTKILQFTKLERRKSKEKKVSKGSAASTSRWSRVWELSSLLPGNRKQKQTDTDCEKENVQKDSQTEQKQSLAAEVEKCEEQSKTAGAMTNPTKVLDANHEVMLPEKEVCRPSKHALGIEEMRRYFLNDFDEKLDVIKQEGCEEEFRHFDQILSDGKVEIDGGGDLTEIYDELTQIQLNVYDDGPEKSCTNLATSKNLETSCIFYLERPTEPLNENNNVSKDEFETDKSRSNEESNKIEITSDNNDNETTNDENNKNDSNTNDNVHSGNLNSMQYILKEIITTEKLYITNLEYIIKEYVPIVKKYGPEYVDELFGNLTDISAMQNDFSEDLNKCADDADRIIEEFLNWEDLFRLYPAFFKTNSNIETIAAKLQTLLEEKQRLLNDKFSLSSYLIKPLQRLGKYILFIENIIKQFTKEEKNTERANDALRMIKGIMEFGNSLVAISSISKSPIKSDDYGSLLLTDKLALLKPKKMELQVFLFTKIIIFTTNCNGKPNTFEYWNSIKTTDITVNVSDDMSLELTDYANKNVFKFNVRTASEKQKWKNEINKILWQQFIKEKEIKQGIYEHGMITIDLEWGGKDISILYCPSKFKNHGALLMMNDFKVTRTARRPEKFTVFIFNEIILLTKLGNPSHYYIDCIKISSINLLPKSEHDNNNTLSFNDSVTSKYVQQVYGDLTYKLEAPSEAIKNQCESILSQCLKVQAKE
ncbi:hypothetical protein GWI33_003449 [Rhynchophorus ferrugineus]|uniref:DH domain-containing protein n=1 Tax=Rhynchophorus ferrugineus TaxID=354439 RepID=A0A834IUW2_RHYFE|nr:hypothetical protein GWI33_003449 [Rhynchophorus ferrugineus]